MDASPLPAIAIAVAVVLVGTVGWRRRSARDRFGRRLRKPLLLASRPDLAADETAIEAPTGTPYRVAAVNGRTVLVEIRRPDGTTARGYTTTAHVRI